MANKKRNVKFIRKGGRIIPIKVKNEVDAAAAIANPRNASAIGMITAAGVSASALLYGSGKSQRASNIAQSSVRSRSISRAKRLSLMKKSFRLNKLAKIYKFGAAGIAGIVASSALTSIDKRTTKDEKSRLFNIGSQSTSPLGIVAKLGVGFAAYRLGKRFEYAGKKGLNLFKKADIKKLRHIRDV